MGGGGHGRRGRHWGHRREDEESAEETEEEEDDLPLRWHDCCQLHDPQDAPVVGQEAPEASLRLPGAVHGRLGLPDPVACHVSITETLADCELP